MKLTLPPVMASALLAILSLAGCGGGGLPDCDNYTRGEWALSFTIEKADDGSCPYEGTYALEGQEPDDLTCGVDGKICTCVGGTEFGVYHVTITDTETGQTDSATLAVEAAPSPECVLRSAVEPFTPVDGLGGMGGSGN